MAYDGSSMDIMREFCTKWWKRIATVDMLFIAVLTLIASLIGSWLKQYPGFKLFGALIIALLIGMIIQFPKSPQESSGGMPEPQRPHPHSPWSGYDPGGRYRDHRNHSQGASRHHRYT